MTSVERNFICHETDAPCQESGCKRGDFCIAKNRANMEAAQTKELARQTRIRHGRFSAEDIGL